ncbi:hypothetical protein [Chitiniphilus eburneus]|uniref:Uncharacterized protein n=1 Tax=Chitiniphilus eburneus TaxID=2571148 RepID=A0A4U0PMR3_9NEIS|nr:hypothetical protein [Chitiniphilus eburneus]TJZ69369.1 hypothetical protein FAZ21_15000 [Chitiniphilus eburneus]
MGIIKYMALCAGLLAVVVAHGAEAERKYLNPAEVKEVNNVVVLRQDTPEWYDVSNNVNPWFAFGMLGALLSTLDPNSDAGPFMPSLISGKGHKLTKAMDPATTNLQGALADQIAAGLAQRGYVTKVVGFADQKQFVETVARLRQDAGVDAILVTKLYSAFISRSIISPYEPYLLVNTAFLNNRSGATLYQQDLTYGFSFFKQKSIHVGSGLSSSFDNMDQLLAQPQVPRKALYTGVTRVAEQVVIDLGKFSPPLPEPEPEEEAAPVADDASAVVTENDAIEPLADSVEP